MVADLVGTRVLLLFATHSSYRAGNFLPELQNLYKEMYGTVDHFEVIYLSLDCVRYARSFPMCIQEMPWLIHSFLPDFAATLMTRLFGYDHAIRIPAIAAFGPQWNLVGKEENLAFKMFDNSDYPFVAPYSTEAAVRQDFSTKYGWNLQRMFPTLPNPSSSVLKKRASPYLRRSCAKTIMPRVAKIQMTAAM